MEFFYYTEHSDQRNTSVIQHQGWKFRICARSKHRMYYEEQQ